MTSYMACRKYRNIIVCVCSGWVWFRDESSAFGVWACIRNSFGHNLRVNGNAMRGTTSLPEFLHQSWRRTNKHVQLWRAHVSRCERQTPRCSGPTCCCISIEQPAIALRVLRGASTQYGVPHAVQGGRSHTEQTVGCNLYPLKYPLLSLLALLT